MTWQRNGRTSAWFMVVGVLVAACTANGGTQPPSAAPKLTVGPAWQAVLEQVRPDGTVASQTALQAFSLAIGPLPGVTVPPGDPGTIPSGTAALRWLVGHWKAISPEQRAAAIALVPELQGLPPVSSASTASGVRAVAVRAVEARAVAVRAVDVNAAVVVAPSPKRSDFFYTQFAQDVAKDIGSRIGRSLAIPIQAKVAATTQMTSFADTGVYTTSGGLSGTAGKCVITISPDGDATDGDVLGAIIAHEVWHCFQGEIGGLDLYWSPSTPAWITEGQAEWVGASLYPNAPINAIFWPNYLNAPQVSLFARSYTAIGFYAQLASSGVDVWARLAPILLAKGNVAAFTAAGADQDSFLNVWASGYAREASRGMPWDITGPGVTADRANRTPVQVADGGSAAVQAPAYANAVYHITDDSAEVLTVSVAGHGRVADAAGHDYLVQGGGTFCHRVGGCECPNVDTTTPPPPALPGPDIVLALTGGAAGAQGQVEGLSLKEYCNRGPLTGTWAGTWVNDNGRALGSGTMTLVQRGKQVTGTLNITGNTCVRVGTVSGTVNGSTVHLVLNSVRVVTMDGQLAGKSMSGTWSAPSCGPPYGPANVQVIVTGTWRASKLK